MIRKACEILPKCKMKSVFPASMQPIETHNQKPRRFNTTGSLPLPTILRCLCGSSFRRVLFEESMTQFYLPNQQDKLRICEFIDITTTKGITTKGLHWHHNPKGICERIDLSPPWHQHLDSWHPNLPKSVEPLRSRVEPTSWNTWYRYVYMAYARAAPCVLLLCYKKWLLFAIMKKHVNSRVWHQPLCPGEIHPRKRRHLCDIPIPWPKGFSKFHLNGNSPPELPPSRAPEANHPWSCHNTRTCPLGRSKPQKISRPWVWRGAFPSISFHSWICWRGIRNYGGTRWISQKKQGKKQFSLIFWVDKNIKTQISKAVSFQEVLLEQKSCSRS